MKQQIREKIRQRRKAVTITERKQSSDAIIEALQRRKEVANANNLMGYLAIHNEVDISKLLNKFAESRKVYVPVIEGDKIRPSEYDASKICRKGLFEVPEPEPRVVLENLRELDVILIPGLAFDKRGNRIGFGKGFYDVFLRGLPALKIGIAYDFQLLDAIEHAEEHDVKMDLIITEKQIIEVSH